MSVMQQVVDFVVTKIYPKKGTAAAEWNDANSPDNWEKASVTLKNIIKLLQEDCKGDDYMTTWCENLHKSFIIRNPSSVSRSNSLNSNSGSGDMEVDNETSFVNDKDLSGAMLSFMANTNVNTDFLNKVFGIL